MIANRIRALGHFAPGPYKEFAELRSLKDARLSPSAVEEMVVILIKEHKVVASTDHEAFDSNQKNIEFF